jgi:hypothetical protein
VKISFRVLLPLLGSLLVSACGSSAGEPCKGSTYTCASETEALECRDSVWRAVPCRGPSGCEGLAGTVRCDIRRNVAGDGCAVSAEGRGLCTADGKAVLECRMGTLVQVKTCGACSVAGDVVTCAP